MFLNLYVCPHCETVWTDTWSATVDDDCPGCGCRHISPTESEWEDDGENSSTSNASTSKPDNQYTL